MRVVLVSTYGVGHQPLPVASPAAALRSAGAEVRCLDLAVERWDPQWLEWGEAVAFSVPMHTAMRLALRAAEALRSRRPELPLCLYGLYAPVSRDLTVGRLVDSVIAGEYEPALVAWVGGLARAERSDSPGAEVVHLGRERFELPARELLPPLERYARLVLGDEERLVGYVEASHGCVHRCRHCPVPAVYDGRIRIVQKDVLLPDVERLVEMGARHLTFGDPDFLNGVKHSLGVVRAVHERFPELTFDCTTKVDHVQYMIRLLIPEGSLLLGHPDLESHLEPYDAERLAYPWSAAVPTADELQAQLAVIVERSVADAQPLATTFSEIRRAALAAAGLQREDHELDPGCIEERPRLSEPWFCCAEPTENQFAPLAGT